MISMYGRTTDSSQFNTDFADLFRMLHLDNVNNMYVMAGDLNAKHRSWRNPVNNARGNAVYSWLMDHGMQFRSRLHHTSLPTFDRGQSYLDIAIADARIQFANTVPAAANNNHDEHGLLLLPYDGDHGAIQMIITLEDDNNGFVLNRHVGRLQYEKVDWSVFNMHMFHNLNQRRTGRGVDLVPSDRNLSNDEIDVYVDALQETVTETIGRHVKRSRQKTGSDKFVTWRIKLLKQRKNQILQLIFDAKRRPPHQTRPVELRRLKTELAHLQKMIKDSFRQSVSSYWQTVFSQISPQNAKAMLPTINRIFRPKPRDDLQALILPAATAATVIGELNLTPAQFITSTTTGDTTVLDTRAMLRVLGYHFAAVNVQNQHLGTAAFDQEIAAERARFVGNSAEHPLERFTPEQPANRPTIDKRFTTMHEVTSLCKATNNKKSTGVDHIPNIVIKHMPRFLAREYGTLFNHCLNNGYFPAAWKTGRVFPLLKKGKDPANPSSYRPITLLPNISKILERIIQRQLSDHAEVYDIMPDAQFGFRRGHSTVHAVSKLLSDICWHKNNRHGVGACLIDTEKAFDTVWLDGLLVKLARYEFPAHVTQILGSMLYGKRFAVSVGTTSTTAEFHIADGLQQGTVLAPLLFAIYTAELLNDAVFAQPGNNIIAYADDVIVYSSGARAGAITERVQQLVDTVSRYCSRWKQRMNADKCEAILFRAPLRRGPADFQQHWKRFGVAVDGHRLETSLAVTYLGVRMVNTGVFNEHCRRQQAKARRAFFSLRGIFYSKFVDAKVKACCYKSLLRPILTYASPAWLANVDLSVLEEYRRFERKCFRCCAAIGTRTTASDFKKYHSNEVIYATTDITRIDNHIIQLTRSHFARLGTVPNASVAFSATSASEEYTRTCMQSGFLPPEAFVYMDSAGYIQDADGIPVLYHIRRDHPRASIRYDAVQSCATVERDRVIFETAIPPCDIPNAERLRELYWWKQ